MKTWWLTWNRVRPYLVRQNRLFLSSMQQKRVKQLSKTKKTSKCEKREVFDWLHAVLWHIHLDPTYTTRFLSLYNSLNRLLFLYNMTCDLYGLDLYLFELLTWSYSDSNSTWPPSQLGFLLNRIPDPWTLLGSDLAYPGLDSSLLELKVFIPFWALTPSLSRELTRVTFTLSAYPFSPDRLTRISPEQLTQTPPECLTRSHQCLPSLIRSYPAKLPYPILLPIRLLLTWPYTVLPGRITLPDSSLNWTSTYPIILGHVTRLPYPSLHGIAYFVGTRHEVSNTRHNPNNSKQSFPIRRPLTKVTTSSPQRQNHFPY
jgi:hypothetical protein